MFADSVGDNELTVASNEQVIDDGDACRKGKWFQTPTCRLKFVWHQIWTLPNNDINLNFETTWNRMISNLSAENLAGNGFKPKVAEWGPKPHIAQIPAFSGKLVSYILRGPSNSAVNGIKHWWSKISKNWLFAWSIQLKNSNFLLIAVWRLHTVLARGPSRVPLLHFWLSSSQTSSYYMTPIGFSATCQYFNQWVHFMTELKPSWRLEFNKMQIMSSTLQTLHIRSLTS